MFKVDSLKVYINEKHILFLSSFIFLILILILAPYSFDFTNYKNSFLYGASYRIEPTYALLTSFIKTFSNEVILIYLVYGIISINIKFRVFSHLTEFYIYSILFYTCYFFLLHEVTQIRASLAAGFFLLSIKPHYERKHLVFILYSLLAVIVHYSAILMIFLWFLDPKKLNKYLYIALIPFTYFLVSTGFSITYLLSFIPIESIQLAIEHHSYAMEHGIGDKINIYNFLQLARALICIVLLIYSKEIIKHNKYAYILLKIYVLSLLSVLSFYDLPVLSFRISEFLGVVEVVVFTFLFYIVKQRNLVAIPLIALFIYHSIFNLQLINF